MDVYPTKESKGKMAPDLSTLEPYQVGQACVDGMYDEPDHTRVPVGDYRIDPEVTPQMGLWFYLGLIDRMYGPACLSAHCN